MLLNRLTNCIIFIRKYCSNKSDEIIIVNYTIEGICHNNVDKISKSPNKKISNQNNDLVQ